MLRTLEGLSTITKIPIKENVTDVCVENGRYNQDAIEYSQHTLAHRCPHRMGKETGGTWCNTVARDGCVDN